MPGLFRWWVIWIVCAACAEIQLFCSHFSRHLIKKHTAISKEVQLVCLFQQGEYMIILLIAGELH